MILSSRGCEKMLECRVDTVNCVLPSKAATHYKFLILSPKSISCYLLPPHVLVGEPA